MAIGFSPLVANLISHWWPSFLLSEGLGACSGQGLDPLAGGRLREPVALLAVSDHERNATLNYRGVLARDVTVEEAELYRRPGHRRRLRRASWQEGPESV